MQPVVAGMDATQARAWVALMSTAQLLPAVLDEQLTADGGLINYEYGILSALNFAKGHLLRMGDLATLTATPAPRVSKAISRLERRGLVERGACPGDGRAINAHLTGEGRRVWAKASRPHIALARDTILATLTSEQLTTLADLLEAINASLDPDASFGRLPEPPNEPGMTQPRRNDMAEKSPSVSPTLGQPGGS